MIDLVYWCNLCNKQAATGILTVMFDGAEEPEELNTCEDCAMKTGVATQMQLPFDLQ